MEGVNHGTEASSTTSAPDQEDPERRLAREAVPPAQTAPAKTRGVATVPLAYLCPGCGVLHSERGRRPRCRREANRARGSSTARGYDKQHRKLRRLAIAQHPYCTDCGATQDLTADHIVPRSRGGQNVLFNYAVRCRRCNSRRGARFLDRQQATPRLKTARESQLVCDLEKLNAETAQTLERIEALLAQTAVSGGLGLSFED
jgi:5-methylcytosine-specific restriction enzyme A